MFHPGSAPKPSQAKPNVWRSKVEKPATATPLKKRASTSTPSARAVLSPAQMLKQRICCDVCTHGDVIAAAFQNVSGDLVKVEQLLRQLHQQQPSVSPAFLNVYDCCLRTPSRVQLRYWKSCSAAPI